MNKQIDAINYYFEEYGEGTPIIFFSGFATDLSFIRDSFEPIFESSNAYKRIYINHPGVGKTKINGQFNLKSLLNSIRNFVERIVGDQQFLIVGASFGGYISRYLLNEYAEQVKGLFLLYPLVTPNLSDANIEEDVVNKKNKVRYKEERKLFIQRKLNVSIKDTDFMFLKNLKEQFQQHDINVLTPYFDKPVCILVGRQDADVGYRDAFKLIEFFPKATFCVLDNASHNLHLEQKELFEIFVNDWLVRVNNY
jgi:pimeloyl-ACP methyl ester carboxylesterase